MHALMSGSQLKITIKKIDEINGQILRPVKDFNKVNVYKQFAKKKLTFLERNF